MTQSFGVRGGPVGAHPPYRRPVRAAYRDLTPTRQAEQRALLTSYQAVHVAVSDPVRTVDLHPQVVEIRYGVRETHQNESGSDGGHHLNIVRISLEINDIPPQSAR